MKNFEHNNARTTHQKSQKQLNDSENYHTEKKVGNDETRPLNENGHILEQVLSDMAWYG